MVINVNGALFAVIIFKSIIQTAVWYYIIRMSAFISVSLAQPFLPAKPPQILDETKATPVYTNITTGRHFIFFYIQNSVLLLSYMKIVGQTNNDMFSLP